MFEPNSEDRNMVNCGQSPWTDEKEQELKKLWENTTQSASQIGRQLGVSKNAIVGKARRMELPERNSPVVRGGKLRLPLAPTARGRTTRAPNRDGPAPPDICLWPLGDPKESDFRFCGEDQCDGRPYCPEHCARAYVSRSQDPFWAPETRAT